jgi:integrase/recombinase XerC
MSAPQPVEPYASLIAEWSRSLRADNKSKDTVRIYTDIARNFHRWCADPIAPPDEDAAEWLDALPGPPAEPDDVEVAHCRAWIGYRLATTSPGNANNNYRGLHSWFAWLVAEDELEHHPMDRMTPPHVPDKPPPVVAIDLMKRVLATCAGRDHIDRRDEAIIRLVFDTGARLAEVGNMLVDDLDLTVDVIRVTGKGGKQRAVPFSPKTGKALSRYLRVRSRQTHTGLPALWLADRNRGSIGPNGIKLMFRRRGHLAGVNDEIGRNLHAHLGRHFAAHQAKKAGMSDGDMMLLFGWTTAQMVQRYGRSAAVEVAHGTSRRLRLGDNL